MNRARKVSDTDYLSLMFGPDMVEEVSIHYGTDFFLETQEQLIKEFKDAANTFERKNIIVRINQNKYKNNIEVQSRQKLLYDLLPYVSDKDFDLAINKIDAVTFQYQTRFNYWISQFEALYGDILMFYKNLESNNAEKLRFINNLIIDIINKQTSPEMAQTDE
jgi:hypothetical protein